MFVAILRNSTLSMVVFGGYLAMLSLLLLFWPTLFLQLGFANVAEPWVSLLGYMLGVLAFLYSMAIRSRATQFYAWTVMARMPLLLFALLLVARDLAPPVLLLLGAVDAGSAIWTAMALRYERRHPPGGH
jgi:hypothetical protein